MYEITGHHYDNCEIWGILANQKMVDFKRWIPNAASEQKVGELV
jgi:hypothetical protein